MRSVAVAAALAALVATPGLARADRPAEKAAGMVAAAWLNAAHKTPAALDDAASLTGLPFWYAGAVYRDAAARTACKSVGAKGTVRDAAALDHVLECLARGTGPYLDDASTWTVIDPIALPRALSSYKAQLTALARTHTLMLVHTAAGKHDDWAVLAIVYDPDAKTAHVAALVEAHR